MMRTVSNPSGGKSTAEIAHVVERNGGTNGSHRAEPSPSFPDTPRQREFTEDPAARVRNELALWRSLKMLEVRQIIGRAAAADVTVLITGETGTGKDLIARAVHYLGSRREGPFVKVNCAAVARELLESELFGHERGAFTGAHQLKIGKFEAANKGTIFLDEIGDLHPALQGKLLHVLEGGQFSRVGARSTLRVDVRVLAATNQDLERAVKAQQFREDLYYRLNVIRVSVPPLRERPEEVPFLIDYFLRRYGRIFGAEDFRLRPETMEQLLQRAYPGNIRELENLIKRMIVLGESRIDDPPLGVGPHENGHAVVRSRKSAGRSLKDIARKAAQAAERSAILEALEETRWNRLRAAELLKVSYRSLLYKIKDCGLDAPKAASS
jgi:transcriptional regulator with GAF, ATPase, and Fis domain